MNSISVRTIEQEARDLYREWAENALSCKSLGQSQSYDAKVEATSKLLARIGMGDIARELDRDYEMRVCERTD